MGKQQKLEQVAYFYIKDQALSGNWPSGHHIIEADIADQLDMSRSPIRAALSRLAEDGTVEMKPYRGYFVGEDVERPRETGFYLKYALVIWYRLSDRLIKQQPKLDDIRNDVSRQADEVLDASQANNFEDFFDKATNLLKTVLSVCDYPFLESELLRCHDIIEDAIRETYNNSDVEDNYFILYLGNYIYDFSKLFLSERYSDTRLIVELYIRHVLDFLPSKETEHSADYSPYSVR